MNRRERLNAGVPLESAVVQYEGTEFERWEFDGSVPGLRCYWPTLGCLNRLVARHQEAGDHVTVTALQAFAALVGHPAGTESMVQRLRSLRRAERRRG